MTYPFIGDDKMNCIIPFESKVKFNCPVKEICSISLEHEITKNDSEVLGNFLVSGTYKEHELSVNTSDFKFTIPFNVELANRIDNDSLEFSIDNFTYDMDGNEMIVKIDYIVTADDVREEMTPEPLLEEIKDPLDLLSEPIKEDTEELPIPEVIISKEVRSEEEEVHVINEEKKEAVDTEIVTGVETENDYMTYHIHIVKETETIESIALTYKVTKDDLEKLNDVATLTVGDKLIIPLTNE